MEIDFPIGNVSAKLRRGWFLGGMKPVAPTESVWLQRPLQLSTHFSLRLDRSWQRTISGHRIRIEKIRSLLVAGIRPHSCRAFVDGELVGDAHGIQHGALQSGHGLQSFKGMAGAVPLPVPDNTLLVGPSRCLNSGCPG